MPPQELMMCPHAAPCEHPSSLPCQPQLKALTIKFKDIERGVTFMVKNREMLVYMRRTTQSRFQAGKETNKTCNSQVKKQTSFFMYWLDVPKK